MKLLGILFILVFAQTLPLWNLDQNLAGGYGDPLAHAALPGWYCEKIPSWNLHTDSLMAPTGADLSVSYDSPFPLILTCPLQSLSSHAQFHFFVILQILLIVFFAWLFARSFIKEPLWQGAYILFVWWCGFYFSRSTQHFTLLSSIWGLQAVLWVWKTIDWRSRQNVLCRSACLGLVFAGTFHNIAMLSFPSGILLLEKMLSDRKRVSLRDLGAGAVLLIFPAVLIFSFFFGPSIIAFFSLPSFNTGSVGVSFSGSWLSPFLPAPGNRLYEVFSFLPAAAFESFNSFDIVILAIFVLSFLSRKFWVESRRWVLLSLALFYFLYSMGPEAGIYNVFSGVSPFSLSRTPGRFSYVCFVLITVIAFEFLLSRTVSDKVKKWMGISAVLWCVVTGPLLNQQLTVPTLKYQEILPMKGLSRLRELPESIMVAHIPIAMAHDPSQNFMQLIHGKKIGAGYLSYRSYTPEVMKPFAEDLFLSQLNCKGNALAYHGNSLTQDLERLHRYLIEKEFGAIILNKNLLSQPMCKDLLGWVMKLAQQPWIEGVEQNEGFAVLLIR